MVREREVAGSVKRGRVLLAEHTLARRQRPGLQLRGLGEPALPVVREREVAGGVEGGRVLRAPHALARIYF